MSLAFRVIARLDVKGADLIKGYQMEGLRKLGDPAAFAKRYAEEGADELLYVDTVASLYGRSHMLAILERTASDVFIPITVAGGVRSVEDARELLRAGADKIAVNTAAITDPMLLRRIADKIGSQALVLSIEAKRRNGGWEAYSDQGRNPTGLEAFRWAQEGVKFGAGEVLLTSVDRDGTLSGPEFLEPPELPVPVVISGGIGLAHHVSQCRDFDALAIGKALHVGKLTIRQVKEALAGVGKEVRACA